MSLLLDIAKEFLAPYVSQAFAALPPDRLRVLVSENRLLFPDLPQPTQTWLLNSLRPYAFVLPALDSGGLAQVIMGLVREQKPEYGFITEAWFAANIEDMKRRLS